MVSRKQWISGAVLSLAILVGMAMAVQPPASCPTVKILSTQVLEPVGNVNKGKFFFGHYVKMFGEWAVVGAYGAYQWKGTAFVFRLVGDNWEFFQELDWVDSITGAYFGLNLAISATTYEEPVIVVGAPFDEPYLPKSGSAHVYDFIVPPGGTEKEWVQTQKLIAPGNGLGHRAAYNGYAVATSGDYIVLGSRSQNFVDEFGVTGEERVGAFYVYKRPGPGMQYEFKQVEFGGAKAQQWGDEMRILGGRPGEGTLRIVLGSPRHNPKDYGAIYTYTFNESSDKFELEQVLIPDETSLPNTIEGNFAHHGEGISVSTNPESVCTGGERAASDKGPRAGGVYCWEKDENGVFQQGQGLYSDKSSVTFFGQRLQRVGAATSVGAWQYNVVADGVTYSKAGAAFVFTQCTDKSWNRDLRLEPTVYNEATSTYERLPQAGGSYGKMMDMSEKFIAVGAPKMNTGSNPDVVERGAVYMYRYELDTAVPLPTVNDIDLEPMQTEETYFKVQNCPGKRIVCPTVTYGIKIKSKAGCGLYSNGVLIARGAIPNGSTYVPGYGTSPAEGEAEASFVVPADLDTYPADSLELRVVMWSSNLGRERVAKSFNVVLESPANCATLANEDILSRLDTVEEEEPVTQNEIYPLPKRESYATTTYGLKNCPGMQVVCPDMHFEALYDSRISCSINKSGATLARGLYPEPPAAPIRAGTRGDVPSATYSTLPFTIPDSLVEGAIYNFKFDLWFPNMVYKRAVTRVVLEVVPGGDCSGDLLYEITP